MQPNKFCCCSVTQLCRTLCNPCSTPGYPVLHYLPESAQIHVPWVDDAMQTSHPLLPLSPPALNLSQHQTLFQRVSSLHQMAKILALQHQSFQWISWKGWFPLGLTGLISLQFKELSRVFSSTIGKYHSLVLSLLYDLTLTSILDCWKNHSFDYRSLVARWLMSLLFDMLSRFVTAFLPRSKCFLNVVAEVTVCSDFGAQENKICHSFHFFPFYLWWSDGTDAMVLMFLNVEFQDSFFIFPLFLSSRASSVPLHFWPLLWYHLHIWGCWYFSQWSWLLLVIHSAQHFTWCTMHIS